MKRMVRWMWLAAAPLFTTTVGQPIVFERTYPITVDGTKTLRQLLADANFDEFDSNITADHFKPDSASGRYDLRIVPINPGMKTKDVLTLIEQKGLAPATLRQLLAFAAAYPEVQRGGKVVEFATVWDEKELYKREGKELTRDVGPDRIVYLFGYLTKRTARICSKEDRWSEGFCVATYASPVVPTANTPNE